VSRAFVKEGDGPEILARPEPELPPGAPNYITPEGAARFANELRAAIARRERLRDAVDGLSPSRKKEVDAEIQWLERRIATFVPTAPPTTPTRVGFGCTVVLEGEAGQRTWRIVGVDEIDVAAGAISWVSPVAKAVLGTTVGATVAIHTPGGVEEWEVVGIG
jgi:transcription elongation factor GreB